MTAPGTPPVVVTNVATRLEVWVGTGSASALQFLGWTVNGATIIERAYYAEVFSDEAGGERGPPVDYQLMGAQHQIELELQRYSETVLSTLDGFAKSITTVSGAGFLMVGGGGTTRLLLCSDDLTTFVRNYAIALPQDSISRGPIGAQATRARISFISNAIGAASPWNTSTS